MNQREAAVALREALHLPNSTEVVLIGRHLAEMALGALTENHHVRKVNGRLYKERAALCRLVGVEPSHETVSDPTPLYRRVEHLNRVVEASNNCAMQISESKFCACDCHETDSDHPATGEK